MAFQSNGPVMLALPPFRGFTRRVILIAGSWFLAAWVLGWIWPAGVMVAMGHVMLNPWSLAHGMVWELVTYPFVDIGLLSVLFALLTVWFFGSQVGDEIGSRRLAEYFFANTVGGGLLAVVLSYVVGHRVPGLEIDIAYAAGMWPASLAILLAFAYFHAEERIRSNFILLIKAKHLAMLYVGGYVVVCVFWQGYRFSALVALMNALCGWLFLKYAPRRGLRHAVSEKWFAMRNEFYRNKRKKAAKEFEVYMRKQGKDVRVDDDDEKKWMN